MLFMSFLLTALSFHLGPLFRLELSIFSIGLVEGELEGCFVRSGNLFQRRSIQPNRVADNFANSGSVGRTPT